MPSKATPGPYKASCFNIPFGVDGGIPDRPADNDQNVCTIQRIWRDEQGRRCTTFIAEINLSFNQEEMEANAHLLAASWEMREALERLTREVRACWGVDEIQLRQDLGNSNYNVVVDCLEQALAALCKASGETK